MSLKVLGIETSCDETAVGVVEDGRRLLSNIVSSQVELHAPYGGVVPEVASRQHIRDMAPALQRALADSGVDLADVDVVAATYGPGLAGSLNYRAEHCQGPVPFSGEASGRSQPPGRPHICVVAGQGSG